MGKVDVLKETTPLSSEDCFLVMQRPKSGFNFPLHVHMEFELNYLENAAGAIRIVGDSVEEIDDLDLVLIAGGTKHAYSNHKCPCNGIFEITSRILSRTCCVWSRFLRFYLWIKQPVG